MPDPLGFPVLAGSAITQAFGFLYGRLSALLDRRAANANDITMGKELPPGLAGKLAPLEVDDESLSQLRRSLESLDDALGVYQEHPELLNGEDERLRRNLGQLRTALETIYHQRFTFEGEERPSTGVKVQQRVEEVVGQLTGLIADEISGESRAEITQVAGKVSSKGEIIGVKVKRIQ